jgi:serine/threonine protein phosphatase PrpC
VIHQIVLGTCINQRRDENAGFDAFAARLDHGLFALCDGANSCPDSGKAAKWLSQQLVDESQSVTSQADFQAHIYKLHHEMLERFPKTASTAVCVKAGVSGIALSTVGDSSLRVYKQSWAGWGPWQEACAMPRDLDEQGRPKQLIGSEVLDMVHQHVLAAQGPLLALMMSDGPANILPDGLIKDVLRTIKRQAPSTHDLDYLCQQLVSEAHQLGCQDDASVAMVWTRWP